MLPVVSGGTVTPVATVSLVNDGDAEVAFVER